MTFICAKRRAGLMSAPERPRERAPERKPGPSDELRELSETFQQTVARLSSLVHELEAAHEKTIRAELEKKVFYREVIRAVTRGKLELLDQQDVPQVGTPAEQLPVQDGHQYAAARRVIRGHCDDAGMSPERSADLLLAAGEAITNAMKHATEGRLTIYRSDTAIVLRVTDRGGGIASHQLPASILTPGFSTKVSLGMGYTMMLKLCDRLWLATSASGTVIQLAKDIEEPAAAEAMLPDLLAL
jgi:anti-sigma regulatory factor (Ser/Thr protein kinase)